MRAWLVATGLGLSLISMNSYGVVDIALNKPVSLSGTFFFGATGMGDIVVPSSIVDGQLVPPHTPSIQRGVYWDNVANTVTIDLEGQYLLEAILLQVSGAQFSRIEAYRQESGWFELNIAT